MQNEPPKRRPRRRGGRGGARPVRPAAQPIPPPARAVAKRPASRPQRRRPQQQQRTPDDLRPGTPCVILMDCREGEPDRSGAVAAFDGYFDFETGEPRRQGHGIPRLRIVRSVPDLRAPTEDDPGERGASGPRGPLPPHPSEAAGPTRAERAEPRSERGLTERVWGFEVWWRPDPTRAGLTDADREGLETSKRLLRGLVRDSSRRALMAPKTAR